MIIKVINLLLMVLFILLRININGYILVLFYLFSEKIILSIQSITLLVIIIKQYNLKKTLNCTNYSLCKIYA